MKTGLIKAKQKGSPFVSTDKLKILCLADGPNIISFTVTLAGQNPKTFDVKGSNVNSCWKRVQAYAKLK